MSAGNNDNFSDLKTAGRISHRLRGDDGDEAIEPESSPAYIAFRAPPAVAKPVMSAPLPVLTPWVGADELGDSSGWASVLDWCSTALDADSAFVMDEQGLVVASCGVLDTDAAQGIGARLVLAFEQADRMDAAADSQSIAIELGGSWLSGLRVPMAEQRLTVGIVASRALGGEVRGTIASAFEELAKQQTSIDASSRTR
jgi:hypothetical protein